MTEGAKTWVFCHKFHHGVESMGGSEGAVKNLHVALERCRVVSLCVLVPVMMKSLAVVMKSK